MAAAVSTPDEYLAAVPDARRQLVDQIRSTILENLPDGLEETISFEMLAYVVPLERFADTYNGQPLVAIALANQKRHVSVYLTAIYGNQAERNRFVDAWRATGRRLDMGKSCVRVTSVDDVAFDVLGDAVGRIGLDQLIAAHEAAHRRR